MTSRPSVPPVQEHKATIAISLSLLFLLLASSPCFAEGKSERREGKSDEKSAQLTVPMAGTFAGLGKFSGTLTVQRFVADNGQVKAVGMVSGTLFDATGVPLGTVLQGPLLFPVTASAVNTRSAAIQPPESINRPMLLKASMSVGPSIAPVARPLQASTCQPLNLSIGAQSFNVLGLTLTTTPIDITLGGQTGGTNALGTLVCNILTTLTNVAGLTNLLNQLLGLLGGL